jgi:hypothetical protein
VNYKVYGSHEIIELQYRTRLWAIVAALLGAISLYLAIEIVATRHEIRGLTGEIVALEQSISIVAATEQLLYEQEEKSSD